MEKKRTSKTIRRILALIPILLIGAVLVFLNTGHMITIKDNAHYPPEQNGQVYTAAEQNGVVRLTLPKGVEEFPDVFITSEEESVDVYPMIHNIHLRHDVYDLEDNGVIDSSTGICTFTISGRYIQKSFLILDAYTLFFEWVCIAALALYLLFLLDCALSAKGKNTSVPRLIFMILLGFLAAGLNDGFNYLQESFSYISVNELMYHYNTNLNGANFSEFSGIASKILLHGSIIAAILILIWFLGRIPAVRKRIEKLKTVRLVSGWAVIGVLFLACLYPLTRFMAYFNVFDYLAAKNIPSRIFEQYYVDPATVEITFPEKKKNLIFIYLESMEITASDKEHGGIEDVDIIPQLTELGLENTCFNGKDGTRLNGGVPLSGTTWTIAGMTAQSAGLPLKVDRDYINDNYGMLKSFMPGATAIGDILKDEGYHNVLMLGSNAQFGNRDAFFGCHGNYDIDDYKNAIATGQLPSSYRVWWGYEDEKLFQFAREKATELAAEEGNFNLTLLTVDTHYTDGYVCELCGNEFDKQYANVLRCNNNQLSSFISWVKEQEWADDTLIVLSGDHLYMDSTFYESDDPGYQRKTYVCFINPSKEEPAEWREYSTFDIYPTTLSALGCDIEGGRLSLGTDLYSGVPTLLEELGEAEINEDLELYSELYDKTIMMGR